MVNDHIKSKEDASTAIPMRLLDKNVNNTFLSNNFPVTVTSNFINNSETSSSINDYMKITIIIIPALKEMLLSSFPQVNFT